MGKRNDRFVNGFTHHGVSDVITKSCDACGSIPRLRAGCRRCGGDGVVPLCFRKVEGGSTHVRPHCLTQLVRVPAIGTMTYIGGLPHILCPEPGCGAPAVVDPACVVTGRAICAWCAFKRWYATTAEGSPAARQTPAHLECCVNCGAKSTGSDSRSRLIRVVDTDSPGRVVQLRVFCSVCWKPWIATMRDKTPPLVALLACLREGRRGRLRRLQAETRALSGVSGGVSGGSSTLRGQGGAEARSEMLASQRAVSAWRSQHRTVAAMRARGGGGGGSAAGVAGVFGAHGSMPRFAATSLSQPLVSVARTEAVLRGAASGRVSDLLET